MGDYVLSERAKKDIRGIADYTKENWSEDQAITYVRLLFGQCHVLANTPLHGRSYDRIRPGLKGAPCGKHVIFYRVLSRSRIRIVRVLHQRMDFLRHL